MCDCLKRIENEVMQDYAIKKDSAVRVKPVRYDYMLFGVQWIVTRRKYNGDREQGWSRVRRYVSRKFNYCPFCGDKL